MTEAEVFSNQDSADAQAADEYLLDKLFGRDARKVQREGKHHSGFHANHSEPVHALRICGEARRRRFGAEYFAGRGIKRECRSDSFVFRRALNGRAQYRLVTEVDAIEVANRQDTAALRKCVVSGPGFCVWERHDRFGTRAISAARCRNLSLGFLIDSHIKLQAVVSKLHVMQPKPAQPLVRFCMRQVMRDMREPRAAWL